jgi:hypothetical protein
VALVGAFQALREARQNISHALCSNPEQFADLSRILPFGIIPADYVRIRNLGDCCHQDAQYCRIVTGHISGCTGLTVRCRARGRETGGWSGSLFKLLLAFSDNLLRSGEGDFAQPVFDQPSGFV